MKSTRIGGFAILSIAVLYASACATEMQRGRPGREPKTKAAATVRSERNALDALQSAEKARDMATDAEADRIAKGLFDEALDLLIAGYDALEAGDGGAAVSYFEQSVEAFEVSRRAALRGCTVAGQGNL